jgi:hypothetical protein
MNNRVEIPIIDILSPYLIDRYDRLKEDILNCYKNLYISDLQDYNNSEITHMFSELLVECVKPKNKILAHFFVKNNSEEIINKIYSYYLTLNRV